VIVIRPIRAEDYSALYKMAEESGHGFTSLPVNEQLLRKRIARSESSFGKRVKAAGDEGYLFVLEDVASKEIMGTCGIEAAVGLDEAFYHYHLGKVVHSSRALNIYNRVDTLTLCNDYTGVSEICTLFLREPYRYGNNGRLLSKCRFLFMAQHPERFADTVIAEMRGVSNERGESPFWGWLEAHFFSMDFPTADYLTGIGQKVFIAELMPKYPIYVNLLSAEAQQVIGQVHEKTKPALKLLQNEGFACRGYVDIFDAGPTVECATQNVKTVRQSFSRQVQIGEVSTGPAHLICNTLVDGFRASVLELTVDSQSQYVTLTQDMADALGVSAGDAVRLAML